jgi:hypothetical protein
MELGLTFIMQVLTDIMFLDDIVNVRHSRTDEKGKNKGQDVVLFALWCKV